jgi:putative ABC transport system permease protein
LIACANVLSLTLTRGTQRLREFSVRTALGAGQSRIARQLLTEGVLVGVLGGALGALIAVGGIEVLLRLNPTGIPRLATVRLDVGGLTLSALLAVGAGVIFGLAPFLWMTRGGVDGLRDRWHSGRAGRSRVLTNLVVAGVALAFVLLTGAGLLVRSVRGLLEVDPGFRTERVLTMEVTASGPSYSDDGLIWAGQEKVLDAVRGLPGVTLASMASQIPLGGNFDSYGVQIKDRPLDNPEEAPSAMRYAVAPDYHEAVGIPLLRGRGLKAVISAEVFSGMRSRMAPS